MLAIAKIHQNSFFVQHSPNMDRCRFEVRSNEIPNSFDARHWDQTSCPKMKLTSPELDRIRLLCHSIIHIPISARCLRASKEPIHCFNHDLSFFVVLALQVRQRIFISGIRTLTILLLRIAQQLSPSDRKELLVFVERHCS